MAHVELSLSDSYVSEARTTPEREYADSLTRWTAAAADAAEPCMVTDHDGAIVVASRPCCALLDLGDPAGVVGRNLVDGVLRLIDFTAARSSLTEGEIEKIPPLLALSSARLARGLMRLRDNAGGELDTTVDAIATPLWEDGRVVGALTFFCAV